MDIALIHESWCFKNDILIYATPIDNQNCKLVIEEQGVTKIGTEVYRSIKFRQKDIRWCDKVKELREEYYNHFHDERVNIDTKEVVKNTQLIIKFPY